MADVFTQLFSQGHGVSLAISHLSWIQADDIAIHQVEETIQTLPPDTPPPPPLLRHQHLPQGQHRLATDRPPERTDTTPATAGTGNA